MSLGYRSFVYSESVARGVMLTSSGFLFLFVVWCSMGGQQPTLPQSPKDTEDYSIDVGNPGENPGYISLFFEVRAFSTHASASGLI